MAKPFFHERNEVCKCRECKQEFKAYDYWEDCRNCNDGEDYENGNMCFSCGGSGTLDSVVKDICQNCLYVQLSKYY